MILVLGLLIFLTDGAYSAFPCSSTTPIDILPAAGTNYPANINDSYYGPNTNCLYRVCFSRGFHPKIPFYVVAEPGKYLQVTVLSNISASDSLVLKNAADLNVTYRNADKNSQYSSPIDIQISLYAKNNNKATPTTKTIVPGGTGAFLQSEVIYNNYAIIKCNSTISIQAQVATPTAENMLYSGFIFAGEGTNGTYLGSLHLAWLGQYVTYNNPPYTVTIVSVDPEDYGIALVKAYSDVMNYHVSLDYAYSSAINQIPLDGTKGQRIAITIFNPNENSSDFYLAAAEFSGLGKTGTPSLSWQTGDLRPSLAAVTNYFADNKLKLLPQPLSGRLNTLIAANDYVRLGFTFDKPPAAFQHVPSGTSTYFTSKNFPYIRAQQGHVVAYKTDYNRARVTVIVRQYTLDSGFSVTYYQAGNPNPFVRQLAPTESFNFIANQFIFNYPQTTANAGCAAYITIEDAGHIPANNGSTTSPGGGSTPKPQSSRNLGLSLLILICSCLVNV